MGLFARTPGEIKQLEQEIVAAKIALGLASTLDEAHRLNVIDTAKTSVRDAATAAAAAGHDDAARSALEQRSVSPADSVGSEVWPAVIAGGLEALGSKG